MLLSISIPQKFIKSLPLHTQSLSMHYSSNTPIFVYILLLILRFGFRWAAARKSQAPKIPKFRSFFGNLAGDYFRLPLSLFQLSCCHVQIYPEKWRQFWESGISTFPKNGHFLGNLNSLHFSVQVVYHSANRWRSFDSPCVPARHE